MDNGQPKILIVDDQLSAREVLKGTLMGQGYNLHFATNGQEALAKAEALTPDLILLDVMMPGMDGFEVCEHLRADSQLSEIPIIMITALDDQTSLLQGLEVGVDDFISKPFNQVELRARVQTITRLNRYRRLLVERSYRQLAEEEIQRRNQELTLLNRVITTAASTLNIHDALYVACEALAQALELPHATAILLNQDRSQFVVEVEYIASPLPLDPSPKSEPQTELEPDPFHDSIPIAGLASEYLLKYKMPLAIVGEQTDPQLAKIYQLMLQHNCEALLIIPILLNDEIIGLIELSTVEQRTFEAPELTMAQSVATAVSQAIETTQLYENLQHHAETLEESVAQRTRELQVERDRTQAILEALGEAVIVTDAQGRIQYINPAATDLTGYSLDEVLGQPWRLWQTDQPEEELYDKIMQTIAAGQTWRGEVVNKHKEGALYDVALTVAPLYDPENQDEPVGFVSVQRDITPLKKAESAKNEFVSNVSHELRTPLSILTLVSDNLNTLYDRLADNRRRKMIRDIQKHTQVLNDLIEDVLEISRIDSGRVSMEREPLDLGRVIQGEAEEMAPLAEQKSQALQVKAIDSMTVLGNSAQLRHVIRNLLNNAIKYTPDNGRIICQNAILSITPAENSPEKETDWPGSNNLPGGTWAAVRIIDTGIGISPEHLPHLFNRFYRVKAERNVRGTGLGLAIAKKLIELHDGHIAVASKPGHGSTFAIYLPVLEQE